MCYYKNLILFLVGYCAYISIEVTVRSVSYPIMGVCGGLAIVIIDKINDYISWKMDIIIQGVIGSLIITSLELIVGEISLHTSIFPVMWNYSNISFCPINNGLLSISKG